jgi:hypothetical protein
MAFNDVRSGLHELFEKISLLKKLVKAYIARSERKGTVDESQRANLKPHVDLAHVSLLPRGAIW